MRPDHPGEAMAPDFTEALPYLLLWLALGAAMFPGGRPGWAGLIALSLVAAVATGIVDVAGLAVLGLFAGSCLAAVHGGFSTALRGIAWAVVLITAIALATHQVPWIHNVLILDGVSVSASAADYTLYWNYDKGFAGVLLYAVCVQPQERTRWKHAIATTGTIALLVPLLIVVPAVATGYVAWDPKWPAILSVWVPANLLLTCVAEETFFRGLVQRHLGEALRGRTPAPTLMALLAGAAAFGAAHAAGGTAYVVLAAVAAIGYGAAYALTGRVESSILVHFTLNLAHLVLFTYPFAA